METQVLIIGAGATGTGLARDLALRGVECMVVERRDINAGASGANHGLLHSGARYAVADPEAAAECREESELLKRLASHCIEDTGGLFVALPGDDENYVADFSGCCSGCGIPVRSVDPREALEMEPELSDSLIAAYRVEDASINPFRLSIDNMAHAEALGAKYMGHTEVIGMERSGGSIRTVRLRRHPDGRVIDVQPRQVVNACGAWAGAVAAESGVAIPMAFSKGSMLIAQTRVTDRVINRLRPPTDGDIVVPGGVVSLIGTTSQRIDRLDSVRATCEEVDLLLAETSKMIPSLSSMRFIRAFAGVRPLLQKIGAADDRGLSRGFFLLDHESDGLRNFISIVGGKLTTFRLMAEKAADLICSRLGVSAPCRTRDLALPESEIGRWIEPRAERLAWLRRHDPGDTLLCECEMVPASVVDRLVDSLAIQGIEPDFGSISLRSRVGKGSCQGAFCAFRICGHLYGRGVLKSNVGLERLKRFLDERWSGLRPVLWGRQLVQEQLQEAIHCGLFSLDVKE